MTGASLRVLLGEARALAVATRAGAPAWLARAGRLFADAALVGAGAGTAVVLLRAASRRGLLGPTVPEVALMKLLGSVPTVLFGAYYFLHSWRLLLLLLLGALLLHRRTRRHAAALLVAGAFAFGAWVAAIACALVHVLDPSRGLAPAALALPASALLLLRRRASPVGAMVVLAVGLCFATLAAQGFYAFPFQDTQVRLLSPLYGFVPPAIVAVLVALVTAWRGGPVDTPPLRRLGRLWALGAVCLSCASIIALEAGRLEPRAAEPAGSRILSDWAYDVHITGDPPSLVWTDRARVQILGDVYGPSPQRYALDDRSTHSAERIFDASLGGFYVLLGNSIARWEPPPRRGQPIPRSQATQFSPPADFREDSTQLWTLVDDPGTRRLITVGEYHSDYAVFHRDSGKVLSTGKVAGTDGVWPWWFFTTDMTSRVIYASSPLDDGGLYLLDLDTLNVTRRARALYLYETALDPERRLLWGSRPLTGEIVGVDIDTFEIRRRIPIEFALRDLQRDPVSGDLFTCSFTFGDVYRVDPRTEAVSRIGWCGRFCRNMFLDASRASLWVATRDGVCRIPVPVTPAHDAR